MTPSHDVPELLFDRHFRQNPSPSKRAMYIGRASALGLGDALLESAVETARDEINRVFKVQAAAITTPRGPAKLHVDFLESREINAFAFSTDGWSFIAITTALLLRFTEISIRLWRLNLLEDILGLKLDSETRDALAAAFILVMLQFVSNHELGHFFHGHCEEGFSGFGLAEFGVGSVSTDSSADTHQLRLQAMEVEADGYAAHMMAENFFNGQIGSALHKRLGSNLAAEEFALNFFLCVLGAVFYLWGNRTFAIAQVRSYRHPPALMRINVFVADLRGWFSLNRPALEAETSLERFQLIMLAISQAAEGTINEELWQKQGEFLLSPAGKNYIDDLYAERERLRQEMSAYRWDRT
jgi:Peptidase family M48